MPLWNILCLCSILETYSSTIKCTHPDFTNSQTIAQSKSSCTWKNFSTVIGLYNFGTHQGETHVNIYDGDGYLKAGQWRNNKLFKQWC